VCVARHRRSNPRTDPRLFPSLNNHHPLYGVVRTLNGLTDGRGVHDLPNAVVDPEAAPAKNATRSTHLRLVKRRPALIDLNGRSRPIRVLVVDDHPLLREGIAALIAAASDISLAGAYASGDEAIRQFRALRPDVTLMDLLMPEMSGLDAMIAIRSEFPEARVVVVTTHAGDALITRALKAGAPGYLLKNAVHEELIDTIRTVHAGRRTVSPEVAIDVVTHAADDPLTPARSTCCTSWPPATRTGSSPTSSASLRMRSRSMMRKMEARSVPSW
jgi:DNA-binding NarL/FixJ family response regulator